MISDINCPKCGKSNPERFAMLKVKAPQEKNFKREILYYMCHCESFACGKVWKEKYLES